MCYTTTITNLKQTVNSYYKNVWLEDVKEKIEELLDDNLKIIYSEDDSEKDKTFLLKEVTETKSKLSNLAIKLKDIMEEGDRVACWITLSGNDKSGKALFRNEFSIFHITAGKITNIWTLTTAWHALKASAQPKP